MASYWKCVSLDWDPRHEDPMVVEAIGRIIAAGEPTPKIGQVYKQVGSYHKIDGYVGLLLEEFDWTEYEIMCSDGIVRSPQVFWNKAKFELDQDIFEPNLYIPNAFGGVEDLHVESFMMTIEIKINDGTNE